jgi:threonine dehydrogenase-like Zn-dependent dehydrogenase
MRATVIHGAGDVRVETVPDAHLVEPTDAVVRVTRAAICGSDLWPYKSMEPSETGRRMGHEFVGVPHGESIPLSGQLFFKNVSVGGGVASARAYVDELLPDVLEGRIEPGRVFDRVVPLDGVPDGYQAMNDREAIKVMVRP